MLLHAGARECLLAVHTKEESHEAFYFTFYEHWLFCPKNASRAWLLNHAHRLRGYGDVAMYRMQNESEEK